MAFIHRNFVDKSIQGQHYIWFAKYNTQLLTNPPVVVYSFGPFGLHIIAC